MAGYDLFAAEDVAIPAKGQNLVNIGITVGIPEGHYSPHLQKVLLKYP